jgi:hypothetical protein
MFTLLHSKSQLDSEIWRRQWNVFETFHFRTRRENEIWMWYDLLITFLILLLYVAFIPENVNAYSKDVQLFYYPQNILQTSHILPVSYHVVARVTRGI